MKKVTVKIETQFVWTSPDAKPTLSDEMVKRLRNEAMKLIDQIPESEIEGKLEKPVIVNGIKFNGIWKRFVMHTAMEREHKLNGKPRK